MSDMPTNDDGAIYDEVPSFMNAPTSAASDSVKSSTVIAI